MSLWAENDPRRFWRCLEDFPEGAWEQAVRDSLPAYFQPDPRTRGMDLLEWVLGEGQFGADHWTLTPSQRLYYTVKPIIPRFVARRIQRARRRSSADSRALQWPVEPRYASFLWDVARNLLHASGRSEAAYRRLWPEARSFALILTHDVETTKGLKFVPNVADLEERFGFRSAFYFVPERYRVDPRLLDDLRNRGFEIGVHGLNHNGKMFFSHARFSREAKRINQYLRQWGAVGYRSPLTHRHPQWMQELDIEYDLSFFDTDPFEPIPGGVMAIWPFWIGRFVELPYTLAQDHTLVSILGESTPRIWLRKIEFLERYHGLALLDSHPDYLQEKTDWNMYTEFLAAMAARPMDYWHALPRDAARWWRERSQAPISSPQETSKVGKIILDNDQIHLL